MSDLSRREALLCRMAGNIAAGVVSIDPHLDAAYVASAAVALAEAIIAEVEGRREPDGEDEP